MTISGKNIKLIEDHDEALNLWRQEGFSGIDLVHVDAHIDFGFPVAKPAMQVFKEAKSIGELKKGLEQSIAFSHYEPDFDKQTNIGNYIYPAMREGIVRDFYWVIPGRLKEFRQSLKIIRKIIKNLMRQDSCLEDGRRKTKDGKNGIISARLFGRKFVICTLEKLPVLKEKILLDIDTDYLVIDSLINADNTSKIGRRKRWIRPDRLVRELLKKIPRPFFTTIAYSVNGGYTPMGYKILGDELAYRLSPESFSQDYESKFIASVFFERFESTGRKEFYNKAAKLNPIYRATDNNYGNLYLSIGKINKAKNEFLKILKVDPVNPAALAGLGSIAWKRKNLKKAKQYFLWGLKTKEKIFKTAQKQCLLGLARVEFEIRRFNEAEKLFNRYKNDWPLEAESYYYLAQIYERKKTIRRAAVCYQDAIKLGFNDVDALWRLFKISCNIDLRCGMLEYINRVYRRFKARFDKMQKLRLRLGKKSKLYRQTEEKMKEIEKGLQGKKGG